MKNAHILKWPGHWLTLVLTFALLLGLHTAPARAQDVSMTINNPQVTTPGSVVTFTGILTFTGSSTNFNAELLNLANSSVTSDLPLTGDSLVPIYLDAAVPSSGAQITANQFIVNTDLFSVTVPSGTAPGQYSGTFMLDYTGGVSGTDYSTGETSTPFTLDVVAPAPAAVPEPSTWAVFVFGGLGVMGMMLRARRQKVYTRL